MVSTIVRAVPAFRSLMAASPTEGVKATRASPGRPQACLRRLQRRARGLGGRGGGLAGAIGRFSTTSRRTLPLYFETIMAERAVPRHEVGSGGSSEDARPPRPQPRRRAASSVRLRVSRAPSCGSSTSRFASSPPSSIIIQASHRPRQRSRRSPWA